MTSTRPQDSSEIDPRRQLAQRYMQSAHDELAAKEAEQPRQRRPAKDSIVGGSVAGLWPSISGSTLVHGILLAAVVTVAALTATWCYVLLDTVFIAGRIIALPTGILVFLTLSYGSAYFQGIVESTSQGRTSPDDALRGSWQDWFWSMPLTWGILAAATGIGWLLSLPFEDAGWEFIGVVTALLYPLMQLSALENGSPLAPFSLPVFRTLITRSLAWICFFLATAIVFSLTALLAKVAWRDPPYLTMLLMGPVATIALAAYGLLLGTMARWLTLKGK